MPTYVYACTECGHHFEAVQSFADDSLTECPECEGRLRKVFNSVGVVFKGSGFYKTDSRSSGSATSPAGGGSTTAASGESSGSGASTSGSSSSGASSSGSSGASPSSGSSGSSATSSSTGMATKTSSSTGSN